MEHPVAMTLCHFGMDVVTAITQFCDFLCKEFYSLRWITEDYTLVDL